jgi:hypothetical protein
MSADPPTPRRRSASRCTASVPTSSGSRMIRDEAAIRARCLVDRRERNAGTPSSSSDQRKRKPPHSLRRIVVVVKLRTCAVEIASYCSVLSQLLISWEIALAWMRACVNALQIADRNVRVDLRRGRRPAPRIQAKQLQDGSATARGWMTCGRDKPTSARDSVGPWPASTPLAAVHVRDAFTESPGGKPGAIVCPQGQRRSPTHSMFDVPPGGTLSIRVTRPGFRNTRGA